MVKWSPISQVAIHKWPVVPVNNFNSQAKAEMVKHPPTITHSMLSLNMEGYHLSKVMDAEKYSSFNFLLRVSAYVIWFVKNVSKHHQSGNKDQLEL